MALCLRGRRHLTLLVKRHLSGTFSTTENFRPSRIVLVRKTTRYEHERSAGNAAVHKPLARLDWGVLEDVYRLQCQSIEQIEEFLRDLDIEIRTVQDTDYGSSHVEWADAILSAGGDGTFLLASNFVPDHRTPVVGLNSDPGRSRGYLCLPRKPGDSVVDTLRSVWDGTVRWKLRHRIRVTMDDMPDALHFDSTPHQQPFDSEQGSTSRRWLALNDVFIGESLSGHSSYLDISVDKSANYRLKCSGLLTYTGTGSTSWAFNANQLPQKSVHHILEIAAKHGSSNEVTDRLVQRVTQAYNESLTFDGSDPVLAYYIRDPVQTELFTNSLPRDVAQRLEIQSRCWNARLVVDGRWTFHFNHGARAQLQLLEEDALRTVMLN